jgi:23S rRNA (adenine2503-C2)-methyltransferase
VRGSAGARRSHEHSTVLEAMRIPDVDIVPQHTKVQYQEPLKNMSFNEMMDWCESIHEKRSRALHIWRWLYADGNWIRDFGDTVGRQDGFGKAFFEMASRLATCSGGLHLQSVHTANDGTRKMLFMMDGDSLAQVETVLIPVVRRQVRPGALLFGQDMLFTVALCHACCPGSSLCYWSDNPTLREALKWSSHC